MPVLDPDCITLLDPDVATDAESLRGLRDDPAVTVIGTWADQVAALAELRPAPTTELLDEPAR
ncbi:hypothetical protein BOO86_04645 [Mycobacterium sp. CBMA 234]|uniref:hypothetical protein n=1 Tax=Mycolicibacterium sp. CBMA 234 TaxID=1918495 RepID=UPI0012DD6AAB|nr:hypothetical protein [Mycolicibacterium sp. CBMA 234]MUL63744.1 hypothetical protein [Mycolicibacterium sp. CBMA 234]